MHVNITFRLKLEFISSHVKTVLLIAIFCAARREMPSPCTASPASGRLLLRSLGTIGFRDVTETNHRVHPCDVTEIKLAVNDRCAH